MALELATSETADQAEIICVGFGHRLATFDRITVVDDLASIMGDLEDITSRAVHAAGDASPFATRVGNGAADTWNPVIVFHADPRDPEVGTLIELAELTDGGVTAVCGYETGSGWTFLVDGDRISCPDLPGSLAEHEFIRPELDGVDLIADLFDEPWGEIDLDERFWDPLDPVESNPMWDAIETGEGSWRPMQKVSETGRVPAESELEPAGGPTSRAEQEIPPLKPLRHSVEHHPGLDEGPHQTIDDAPPSPSGSTPETVPAAVHGPPPPSGHPTEGSGPADALPPAGPPTEIVDDDPPRGRHLYVVGGEPGAEPPVDAPGPVESPVTERAPDDGGSATSPPAGGVVEPPAGTPAVGVGPDPGHGGAVGANGVDGLEEAGPGADIRVSVLGDLMIEGHHPGDRRKPWKYTKTPELILYLLLHPGGASQDLLMEQLFPEQPPNRPRLNQLVSDARTKALGLNRDGEYHLPHASPTEPFYKLRPTVAFDLRDFAQHCANARKAERVEDQVREWQAALELVRGRPFTLPHDGYEWALPEIEATIVKVEEAAVALADLAVEQGDHELAVWATKQGLLTGTGYYELLVRRGRAALMLQDPEEIVRAFADLQVSLDHTGAPEEGMPDLTAHPDLENVYNELSSEGRGRDRNP